MKKISTILLLLILISCKSQKIMEKSIDSSSETRASYQVLKDELHIKLTNLIKSPIRFFVTTKDNALNSRLANLQPITLQDEKDTLIIMDFSRKDPPALTFQAQFGDLEKEIKYEGVALPLPKNKSIRIIQGYHGKHSHNKKSSRYAIDFDLKLNDTIYSASDGFVLKVTEKYKYGGEDIKWLNFANKIFTYNPETGLFFLYSHLVHNGSLVEPGDEVKQGQPIGLSGSTGYSDIPHLHFTVLIPDSSPEGTKSVPVNFAEGYKGEDLVKNGVLKINGLKEK